MVILFDVPEKVQNNDSTYVWDACVFLTWGLHRTLMCIFVISDLIKNVMSSETSLYKLFGCSALPINMFSKNDGGNITEGYTMN